MWTTFESLAVFGLLCVIAVLLLGIGSMAGGGKDETAHADSLMRWRVGTQAAAIVLLLLGAYVAA